MTTGFIESCFTEAEHDFLPSATGRTNRPFGARCLDDESAPLRFLREARTAASVRQPNVASVFHHVTIGAGN